LASRFSAPEQELKLRRKAAAALAFLPDALLLLGLGGLFVGLERIHAGVGWAVNGALLVGIGLLKGRAG